MRRFSLHQHKIPTGFLGTKKRGYVLGQRRQLHQMTEVPQGGEPLLQAHPTLYNRRRNQAEGCY